MRPQPTAPTTQEIRAAVATIHHAVYDPDACPAKTTQAHNTLIRASHTTTAPVSDWLDAYLDTDTIANGHLSVRAAVDLLAQHFKLPPERHGPPPGQQGTLFD
jgi:hypothetical protein